MLFILGQSKARIPEVGRGVEEVVAEDEGVEVVEDPEEGGEEEDLFLL